MRKPLVLLLCFGLFAGCSSGGGADSAKTTLTGAGATFPYPLYTRWISEYAKTTPSVVINYQSIGSGGGIRQLTENTIDFGASDAPMTDDQLAKAPSVLHIPTCVGAVALAYNVEGASSGLKLSPGAISGIYLGSIKTWNDPKILADNPGVSLPSVPIVTIHRSDGSGTTKLFVDYLSQVNEAWANGPGSGTSVAWPGGLAAKGNEGVAGLIKSQTGTIGYVELAYAVQNKMDMAAIRNKAGAFVSPLPASITLAAHEASARMPEDLRLSIVDAEGQGAYPIAGFTYILLYSKQQNAAKGRALVGFLSWALGAGQKLTDDLHYAPLPPEVASRAKDRLLSVTGPDGKPLS